MSISSASSPLSDDQARRLKELAADLDDRQLDWVSGFLAGLRAAGGEQSAAMDEPAADNTPALTVLYGSQTPPVSG